MASLRRTSRVSAGIGTGELLNAWRRNALRLLRPTTLIYCPDHPVANVNAAALDMSRIVDINAKDGLGGRIRAGCGATLLNYARVPTD